MEKEFDKWAWTNGGYCILLRAYSDRAQFCRIKWKHNRKTTGLVLRVFTGIRLPGGGMLHGVDYS